MKLKLFSFVIILVLLLSACNDMKQLSRVDVQALNSNGTYGEPIMITDKDNVILLREAFEQIEWEENSDFKVESSADLKATLFFDLDKNKPEKIKKYLIRFNNNDETATVISSVNKDEYDYGTLNKGNAKILKEILLNK